MIVMVGECSCRLRLKNVACCTFASCGLGSWVFKTWCNSDEDWPCIEVLGCIPAICARISKYLRLFRINPIMNSFRMGLLLLRNPMLNGAILQRVLQSSNIHYRILAACSADFHRSSSRFDQWWLSVNLSFHT